MKYYVLDEEEKKIIEDIENDKLVSVKDFEKQKKLFMEASKNTLNKTRNINIRISEKDLQKLKAKAAKEGIPYQTLVSSILHQNAN